MGNKLEMLQAEALLLSAEERATLAQVLLASLDTDAEYLEAWAQEIEKRIADLDSGVTQAIPLADALAQLRAAIK